MTTHRCCPICFRGSHVGPTNFPPGEGKQKLNNGEPLTIEQKFFQVFSRYIDTCDDADGEFPFEKLTDHNLICCGECTKVMESFCELYHKMKTIELHLNWKVLTLKNIMMGSKRVAKRTANFEECVKRATKNHRGRTEVDVDAGKIIKTVMKARNMWIEKCCQKITCSFPKITIKKRICQSPSPIGTIPKQKQITCAGKSRIAVSGGCDGTDVTPDRNSNANTKSSIKDVAGEESIAESTEDPEIVSPPDIIDDNYDNEDADGCGLPSTELMNNKISHTEFFHDTDEISQIKAELEQNMDIDLDNTPLPDLHEVSIISGVFKMERSVGGLRASFRCTHCSMTFSLKEKLQLHITEAHGCTKRRNEALTSSSSSESDEDAVDNDYDSDDNMSLSSTSISSNDIESDMELDVPTNDACQETKKNITEKPNICSITSGPPNDNKINTVAKKAKKKMYCIKKYSNNFTFRLTCPDCDELFKDVKSILLHRKDTNACEGKYDPATVIRVEIRVRGNPKSDEFTITSAVIDLPQSIFICEECDLPLYNSEQAEAHKKLHGIFPCKFCKVTKTYAPELAIHELRHKSENKKIKGYRPGNKTTAFCPRCDFKCSYWASTTYVKHHLKSHLSLLYENPICGICYGDFFKCSAFLKHLKEFHDLSKVTAPLDIKRCTIGDCRAYFLTSYQLTSHLKRYHNVLNFRNRKEDMTTSVFRYKCQDCDKSYLSELFLRSHRLKKHVSSKEAIPCLVSKCPRIFESKRELEQHMKISAKLHAALEIPQKEKPTIYCPQCNKPFAGEKALKNHSKSHRRTPIVCDICGMVFKYKAHLDRHYAYHTKPEDWEFECEICKKKCPSNCKLKEHMRTHTQERKFICQVCGAKYGSRHNLRVHVNSKHGDVVQDIPKKVNKTNFKSRKGTKRWKPTEVASSSSSPSVTASNVTRD